jgi:hypothetical protein
VKKEQRSEVQQGEKLSTLLLHSIEILNFDTVLATATFGGNFVSTWGFYFRAKCYVSIGRAACEAHKVTCNADINSALVPRTEKEHRKPL